MKTCKDCIHQQVCIMYDAFDYEEPTTGDLCRFFKDKSKFIEKPFDIRDTIYVITKYNYSSPYEIVKCIVDKIRLKDGNTVTFSCSGFYANKKRYVAGTFKTSAVGKTVFLTREEAEKKLEELK